MAGYTMSLVTKENIFIEADEIFKTKQVSDTLQQIFHRTCKFQKKLQ